MGERLTMIREQFAGKYRTRRDATGDWVIPLRGGRGEVYEYSATALAVHFMNTRQPNKTANVVKAKVPSARVVQEGDFEVVLVCPVEDAEAFLRAVGAQTIKQVSEEERKRLAEIGAAGRWPSSERLPEAD